jgi:hypothetical protein
VSPPPPPGRRGEGPGDGVMGDTLRLEDWGYLIKGSQVSSPPVPLADAAGRGDDDAPPPPPPPHPISAVGDRVGTTTRTPTPPVTVGVIAVGGVG